MRERGPHCGECPFLLYEDTDGFGTCSISERERRCSDRCYLNHKKLTPRQTVKILHYVQKWRKGAKIPMILSHVLTKGIDAAIFQLRKTTVTSRQSRRTTEIVYPTQ